MFWRLLDSATFSRSGMSRISAKPSLPSAKTPPVSNRRPPLSQRARVPSEHIAGPPRHCCILTSGSVNVLCRCLDSLGWFGVPGRFVSFAFPEHPFPFPTSPSQVLAYTRCCYIQVPPPRVRPEFLESFRKGCHGHVDFQEGAEPHFSDQFPRNAEFRRGFKF